MAYGIMTGRRVARAALVGVLAGLAGLLSGASAALAQSSQWTTDSGPLVLVVRDGGIVTGSFPQFDGRFEGHLDVQTGVIDGFWIQPTSEMRCDTPISGSFYWGQVVWQVSRNGALRGQWAYCWQEPTEQGYRWDGTLTRGTNPLDTAMASADPGGQAEPADPGGAPLSKSDLFSRYGGAGVGAGTGTAATTAAAGDAMATARFLWGQSVDAARLTVLREDITCDGKPDLTLAYHNVDTPGGPFLEVAVRETGSDLESIPVAFLDFDQGGFQSLCGGGGPISVTVEGDLMPADVEALTGVTAPPLCRVGLRVDDGLCDAVWVFTTPGIHRRTDFVFGRN